MTHAPQAIRGRARQSAGRATTHAPRAIRGCVRQSAGRVR